MGFPGRPFEQRFDVWLLDTQFFNDNGLTSLTRLFFMTLRSEETRLAYFKALKRFFARGLSPDIEKPEKITAFHIQGHINMVGGPRPADPIDDRHLNTRALALSALRRYFGYLHNHGVIPTNPAKDATLSLPKRRRGKTLAMKPEEVGRILDAIDSSTPLGRRDAALVAFLAYTACRIGAALKLNQGGLGDAGMILFTEKGNRENLLPMPGALKPYLDAYLADLGMMDPREPVFRAWDATVGTFAKAPMPYLEAYLMVRARVVAAGVTGRITPHSFRATAITELLDNGMPLQKVQKYANHADVSTTLLYDRKGGITKEDTDLLGQIFSRKK